jgi:hypothetical protein
MQTHRPLLAPILTNREICSAMISAATDMRVVHELQQDFVMPASAAHHEKRFQKT